MTVRTLLYGGLAFSIAIGLLTLAQSSKTDEHSLQSRVEAYWQARVQNDMPRALQYEHPAYQKRLGESISLARLRSGVRIKEFSLVDPQALQLDPAAREAEVALTLKYEYTIPFGGGPMLTATSVQDPWRKIEGVWYHILDPRTVPRRK